eukprot:TRINITY_DN23971_c0_g3_i1.p1 TRINITY_DN23971_c0_g3~~TRINITY_DN23971_c0_g3_i1.p1  ORF type:complete len:530 (-),score=135.42 TRINITY_DN23971_c0_g3_i1:215-1804(-)
MVPKRRLAAVAIAALAYSDLPSVAQSDVASVVDVDEVEEERRSLSEADAAFSEAEEALPAGRRLADAAAAEGAPAGGERNSTKVEDPFAYHKELWPLSSRDIGSLLLMAVGLIIAAGGGIGGGSILVPLLMICMRWHPKHAVALSNVTICGGAIANCLFNAQKVMPDGRRYIDWDIILIMEPSTIVGAILGSFASKYLPDIILTVALTIVLALLAQRTLEKGISMYRKENEEKERGSDSEETAVAAVPHQPLKDAVQEQNGNHPAVRNFKIADEDETTDDSSEESEDYTGKAEPVPWHKIFMLMTCSFGCVVFTVLKGGGHGSIVGVVCGSILFWIFSFSSIPWVIGFQLLFRRILIREYNDKMESDHLWKEGDIKWDERTTIVYPLVCTISGVFAGLFGVGGGIVKGPLMLEMGVLPVIASATAATMILFTSSAACVSFYLFGMLQKEYAALFFVLGFVCTAFGQGITNQWMKSAKRQSPPVLSIGTVLGLSTIMVCMEAIAKYVKAYQDTGEALPAELFEPTSLCSS